MKYLIKTFGCQMNHSDSERIAGLLERSGFEKSPDSDSADLVILNTCGVRQMAEDRIYGQVHNLRHKDGKLNVKIVITGCLAERQDVRKRLEKKVDFFLPIDKIGNLPEKLGIKNADPKELEDYFHLAPLRKSKFSALVPIMTGCNNFCSYCVVPYARGREVSRSSEEILKEIRTLVKKGYKEIILLGQNVNSYNFKLRRPLRTTLSLERKGVGDEVVNFPRLLRKIDRLPGKFWISFMSNHPKDISPEFIQSATKLKKVSELIHLPLQAGDDLMLQKMNRKYTSSEYLRLGRKIKASFRKNKPGKLFSLTSDIIVGFPGETRKRFLESAKVMEKMGYDMVYFGQYSPRPGTAAWKMKDDVSKGEKVRREKYLNSILEKSALQNNRKYVGRLMEILIDYEKDGSCFGRTRTGKNVRLENGSKKLIGEIIKAEITKANPWNLEARLPEKRTRKK